MKITLHLLALCLLLSITTKVSGKPNPRHLLIETEEQAKAKNNDDYQNSQIMTGNDIRGGSVSQDQSNGGGWGVGSHLSSRNTQSMGANPYPCASVNQLNCYGGDGGGDGGGWGGGSRNHQSMTGNTIHDASVSQTQSNGGGF